MTAVLTKLTAADAAAFQALRLEGLANHPSEFGAALEEEADLTLDDVARRLDASLIYGAFVDGQLRAIAGFRRPERIKKRHKGELFGVYVSREARGRGLGEVIVRHVISKAKTEVQQLLVTVVSGNLAAKRLYAKLGFETYGREPRALKVGDRYFDQTHMVLILE